VRETVEQVRGLGEFDAVVAVMALHHTKLDVVTSAFTALLRPHGRLFVYDLEWDAYDDRAAGWLAEHDSSDADNSVAGWRREHSDLHTGAAIRNALNARFAPVLETRRPYLARMLARRDLEAMEHALIDARMLPALGFWVIAARKAASDVRDPEA
jgi:SAM-dependent methyltransferase